MNCLHPFTRKYIDAITGETKECVCPCGKCINCLHAYQDMWSIRLTETAKTYKCMIYDTLTIRPESMHTLIDFKEPTSTNTLYGSTTKFRHFKTNGIMSKYRLARKYYPNMSKESWKLLQKTNFTVPTFPKSEVQCWLKRGRQAYFRDKGVRCDFAYFIVEEYGPQTSRPHFHILVFGLSYADYMKYFGNPWKRDFGWTKPVYKEYTAGTKKDFNCMVRYVSKYVSKGVFESPWVKDGFAPKPYRLISKGLGEGYLERDFFKIFRSEQFTKWIDYHRPTRQSFLDKAVKLKESGDEKGWKDLLTYYDECCSKVNYALEQKALGKKGDYIDLSSIPERSILKLQVYYDDSGFAHALPQYYRNKLFRPKNEKNIYQFEIQAILQSRALLHDNQTLQREALTLGIDIPDSWLTSESSTWKLSPSDRFILNYFHLTQQRNQARAIAERRYLRLTNIYNRSKINMTNPAAS